MTLPPVWTHKWAAVSPMCLNLGSEHEASCRCQWVQQHLGDQGDDLCPLMLSAPHPDGGTTL